VPIVPNDPDEVRSAFEQQKKEALAQIRAISIDDCSDSRLRYICLRLAIARKSLISDLQRMTFSYNVDHKNGDVVLIQITPDQTATIKVVGPESKHGLAVISTATHYVMDDKNLEVAHFFVDLHNSKGDLAMTPAAKY
jgi:hypothetical protein